MSEGLNSWPAGLLTRVRKLEKIYKTTVKLQPVNQGSVTAGNKILLIFNADSVYDLKSLSFDAYVQTCQNGNQSNTAANNYTQSYYLPRNGLASLISQIDIRIAGRSIQNISQYNYLYNISFKSSSKKLQEYNLINQFLCQFYLKKDKMRP